jgi:CubicO group peptidase (beta-lactamase class C family)
MVQGAVEGTVAPGFEGVRDAFARQFESGQHIGAAVAVYHRGRPVVDLWGGVADDAAGTPWREDTMCVCYSTTKGLTATCLHVLADRGLISYDDLVSKHWPEFAQHGKEHVTVRHVLTHQAGIPQQPDGYLNEALLDWDKMIHGMEQLEPLWEPGTANGYHAYNFGWLVGELVRRVSGRSVGTFLREEIAAPLGIDGLYIGAPASAEPRIARVTSRIVLTPEMEAARATISSGSLLGRAMPAWMGDSVAFVNTPAAHQAEIPAITGTMTARDLARMYAAIAQGGELDGTRIMSAERVRLMVEPQPKRPDKVISIEIPWGLGYMLGGGVITTEGPRATALGHPGFGGSIGFADPEIEMAFGFVPNALTMDLLGGSRSTELADAARAAIAAL